LGIYLDFLTPRRCNMRQEASGAEMTAIIINQAVFRPSTEPSHGLPFGVHSAGFYKIRSSLVCNRRVIRFAQIFWCASGSGIIEINGKKRILSANQVALYFPGMYHNWDHNRGIWTFHWIALDGPLIAPLLSSFGLEASIYDAGPPPVELFAALNPHVLKPTRQDELEASAIAFSILARAAKASVRQQDALVREALDLMHLKWNSPEMNVKTLVAASRQRWASFSRRFYASVGVTPGKYLERLKIQNALVLLQHTSQPIKDVSRRCGFSDPNYFSRLIRNVTGKSPLQFRSESRPNRRI